MTPFAPLLFVIPLCVFYLWMFRDMLNNEELWRSPWMDLGLGNGTYAGNPKSDWTFAFLLFNVFAAAVYYVAEYKRR